MVNIQIVVDFIVSATVIADGMASNKRAKRSFV